MFDAIRQDVAFTFRMLRKHASFTAVIVLVLALGIGGSTAIFSVVNNTLLRPMMLRDVDRIMRIDDRLVGGSGDETNISPANVTALLAQQHSFAAIAVQDARTYVLTGNGEPQRLRGSGVSDGWNDALGVQPILGRGFTSAEIAARSNDVVMIGYSLWRKTLGGSRDAIGRTLTLNGAPRTIIGVMPAGFEFPYEAQVWQPVSYDATDAVDHYLLAFGRLRPGISREQAQTELAAISARVQLPASAAASRYVMTASSLRENLVRGYDRTALALLAVVGFLLLLACVNVSGLLLVRMTTRRPEMIIRASLGATRARQVAQLLTESVILSVIGGAVGLAVSRFCWPYLALLVPPTMSRELAQNGTAIDLRVFLFAAGIATLAGVAVGVIPALRAAPADLAAALRSGGRTGGARVRGRTLPALVTTQVALAMTLLVGAGGVVRGFATSFAAPGGYDPAAVLTMRVSLAGTRYATAAQRGVAADAIRQQIAAVPGVTAVALTTTNPRLTSFDGDVIADDATQGTAAAPTSVQYVSASPGLFDALHTRILAGRDFDASDRDGSAPVVIVSHSLAERLWPRQSAIGRRIRFPGSTQTRTVIAVAPDIRYADAPFTNAIYTPYAEQQNTFVAREFHLMVRTADGAGDVSRAVQRAVWNVDANIPLFEIAQLDDVVSPEYLVGRTGAAISAAFGVFSLLLASFGIFGVLSFAVSQGRRDSAIRIALGASPGLVIRTMFVQSIVLVALGTAIGCAGGIALTAILRSRLGDVAAIGVTGYAFLLVILFASGAIACAVPLRRIVGMQAMGVLRED